MALDRDALSEATGKVSALSVPSGSGMQFLPTKAADSASDPAWKCLNDVRIDSVRISR